MEKFTDELWSLIASDIYPAILSHPFLQGLLSGNLEEAAFRHYVQQDSLYLEEFGRCLAMLASKADSQNGFMMFCEHARNTMIVEGLLHQGFKEVWKEEDQKVEMSPTAVLYTRYLLDVVNRQPYHEGLSAVLPCYWIYRKVGLELVKSGSSNPLYQRWIDTYAGEEFGKVVEEVLAEMNRLAERMTTDEKERTRGHFRKTSACEFKFWDMGYRKETWDIVPQ